MTGIAFAIVAGLILALWGYFNFQQAKYRKAVKANAALTTQNNQLQAEVKNHQVRTKNVQKNHSASDDDIVNELHANGDLRD